MPNPRESITVYIPSYNQRKYLAPAIQSVLDQTRTPDQILIIDDASTDGSADLIREYQRQHPKLIDVVIHSSNQGNGELRRRAIHESTGDLITYLDGDDLYYPKKIELEEQALAKHPSAGFVYSNFDFVNEHGKKIDAWFEGDQLPTGDQFERYACFGFPGATSSRCELVRREIMLERSAYEPGLNIYQVHDAKLRIARHSTCVAVIEPTHAYRKHSCGVHRSSYARHYTALRYIYEKNEDLFVDLDDADRNRMKRSIHHLLADHAWETVREKAHRKNALKSREIVRFACAGVAHRPLTALNPKNLSRFVRAVIR